MQIDQKALDAALSAVRTLAKRDIDQFVDLGKSLAFSQEITIPEHLCRPFSYCALLGLGVVLHHIKGARSDN